MKTLFVSVLAFEGTTCILFPRAWKRIFVATVHPRALAKRLDRWGVWVYQLLGLCMVAAAAVFALVVPPG